MAQTIRFRGSVTSNDASTAVVIPLYKEGTDELITVGSSDLISLEGYQVSAQTGVTTMFLSTSATAPAYGYFFRGLGTQRSTLPSPARGIAGQRPYVGSSGANRVDAVVFGTIYQP